MKRTLAIALVASALAASVALATGTANLTPEVRDALTSIDTVPTKSQIDSAFDPANALDSLSEISQDTQVDIGVRVRAIHALAKYCPDPCSTTELAHQSLSTLINNTSTETIGEPLVLLRAAIETIGILAPLLDHSSRDIRAATARALRDLCNPNAVFPLRIRYTTAGETEQVKLAISEALRVLEQCGM